MQQYCSWWRQLALDIILNNKLHKMRLSQGDNTNFNKCATGNQACGKFRAFSFVVVPVYKWKNISIPHYLQIIRGFPGTLIYVIPVSRLAIALLPWPAMYCHCTSSPRAKVCYQRVDTIPPFKICCPYLVQ